jgi:hypothetical protein
MEENYRRIIKEIREGKKGTGDASATEGREGAGKE